MGSQVLDHRELKGLRVGCFGERDTNIVRYWMEMDIVDWRG